MSSDSTKTGMPAPVQMRAMAQLTSSLLVRRAQGRVSGASASCLGLLALAYIECDREDHNGNWPLWFGGNIVANGTGAVLNETFS